MQEPEQQEESLGFRVLYRPRPTPMSEHRANVSESVGERAQQAGNVCVCERESSLASQFWGDICETGKNAAQHVGGLAREGTPLWPCLVPLQNFFTTE